MNVRFKKYLLIALSVFLVGCSSSSEDDVDTPPVVVESVGESLITTTQAYKTAYFTGFTYQNGNNLFEEADGTLHIAFIDNYELFYSKSLDGGKTWNKEKIETGHDGALRRASLTVDKNGKVFIGYNTHDKFNYADETSVAYGTNFEYDLYCATNKSGTWSNELLYTHENGTTGREIMGIDIDANNNIHLFATYYGWWSYGGTAYEYIRLATTDTWSSATQIAKFTDTSVDKFIYGYAASHIQTDGNITVVAMRAGSSVGVTDKLFYIKKESGIWQAPVEFATPVRTNPRTYHFDSAMDSFNHIYVAYVNDDVNGNPQVLFSEDFGEATAVYTAVAGEVIHSVNLHSDDLGNLTLVVNNDTQKSVIATKSATGSWSEVADLDTDTTNGMMYHTVSVQTNTAVSDFTTYKMSYTETQSEPTQEGVYGPYGLFFYSHSAD